LGLLHLLSSFSLIFAHKLSVYSIIVDKQVTSFDPKIGWDKSLAKAIDGTGNLYYKLHAHGYHQIWFVKLSFITRHHLSYRTL